jgi:ABC-type transport system involved in cytochrome c biogenesis permease component
MTVLPIVGRELGVAARRAATYWTRFGVAVVALGIFAFLTHADRGQMEELGQDLFVTLGVPTLGFCMLAGVFFTADSLSAEKREGTLGLLFLTDLKGYDVVLGKLAAHSVHAFFGLLAVFPVLALCLLTGGVGGGEFWRTALVFVCALYFSLAVGMIVSAASREGRQALGGAIAAILILHGVVPLLEMICAQFFQPPFLILLWPNPAFAYYQGFDDQYRLSGGRLEFWRSIIVILALATACIVAASVMLPRSWRKTPSADAPRKRGILGFFGGRRRASSRPALTGANPYYWLALGDRGGQFGLKGILVLLLALCAGGAALGFARHDDDFFAISIYSVFPALFLAKIMMAVESGRRFNQDRQSGALELLLVTPLPVKAIVAGQRDALRAQFRLWIWALSLAGVLTLLLIYKTDSNHSDFHIFAEIFLGNIVLLWLDSAALIWLGMWTGLKARKHSRAVLVTLAVVLALPWVSLFVAAFLAYEVSFESEDTVGVFIVCWFLLGAVVDGLSVVYAREKLASDFRALVARRYDG